MVRAVKVFMIAWVVPDTQIREAIAREKCSFFEHCSKGL